jgi:hypothetical protein
MKSIRESKNRDKINVKRIRKGNKKSNRNRTKRIKDDKN